MKRRIWFSIVMVLIAAGLSAGLYAGHIEIIQISGPITPVTAKYISDAIKRADRSGAECLIIEMDTPGGLMQSTWTIDKKMLEDRVPVVLYISPSGGRAASAGVFISYASHVLAMAPSTNIGSAHPVTMGGGDSSKVMMEKVTNDAVAHIKGLADKRGRNGEWAEQAVRESVSITEKEAVEMGVADLIADDLSDLIDQLEGREITLGEEKAALETHGKEIRRFHMDWRYKILDKISDPNIAYILMMLGIYGLFFELSNPGSLFPGILGGICLLLAFFALQVLPINTTGILLILLSIILFLLEIKITSYGLLTIGGVTAMILGSLMLFRTPVFRVSLSVIITFVAASVVFFVFALGMALRAHKKKATTGNKGLMGERGEALTTLNPEGQVAIHGEIWKAERAGTEKIKKGEKVTVVSVDGLTLKVRKVKQS